MTTMAEKTWRNPASSRSLINVCNAGSASLTQCLIWKLHRHFYPRGRNRMKTWTQDNIQTALVSYQNQWEAPLRSQLKEWPNSWPLSLEGVKTRSSAWLLYGVRHSHSWVRTEWTSSAQQSNLCRRSDRQCRVILSRKSHRECRNPQRRAWWSKQIINWERNWCRSLMRWRHSWSERIKPELTGIKSGKKLAGSLRSIVRSLTGITQTRYSDSRKKSIRCMQSLSYSITIMDWSN